MGSGKNTGCFAHSQANENKDKILYTCLVDKIILYLTIGFAFLFVKTYLYHCVAERQFPRFMEAGAD